MAERRRGRGRIAAPIAAVLMLLGTSISCDDHAAAGPEAKPTTTAPASAPSVEAAAPTPLRPPAGDPLETIDRDAGINVALRDGSSLWLFGDTAARADDGTIVYFQIGTASWSSADAPTTTHDYRDPETGAPVTFATPTADFPACPSAGQRAGMWPASAVVQPVGPRDRVIVWLHDICLGADGSLADRGMALAEWWYDPADPPVGRAITATILEQRLFPGRSYGSAAVLAAGGDVYAYRCATPNDPTDADAFGPCAVARVPLASVADPAAYVSVDDDLALPRGSTAPVPPGGFSVAFDATLGSYVMVDSPWPGPTQAVDVRTAPSPTGPWSRPTTVGLPGCADRIGSRQFNCYAGSAQPSFSTPGHLGIGYYDSSVSTFPTRGAYMITTVPWGTP